MVAAVIVLKLAALFITDSGVSKIHGFKAIDLMASEMQCFLGKVIISALFARPRLLKCIFNNSVTC